MTITERERRIDSLLYGSVHREELCRMVAMREYELDELKSLVNDMHGSLCSYLSPEQAQEWADRLEKHGIYATWGWRE